VNLPLFGAIRSNFLFGPALAVLMLSVCLSSGKASRFLASRPLRFTGDISYSVYIWQFSMMSLLGPTLRADDWSLQGGMNMVLKAAVVIGLTTAFAYGSYSVIEVPARRWLRSVLEPKSSGRKASVAHSPSLRGVGGP